MKKTFWLLLLSLSVTTHFFSQDLGKIILRNGSNNYPKFIASLNGIRLSNDYAGTAIFSMLDDNIYKLKLLQAGSTNLLTFTLSSEPRYLSKYVITKDNVGNFIVMLESKSLMLDDQDAVANPTVVVNPTVTAPATVILTQTVAVNTATAPQTTSVAITNISAGEFNERLGAVKRTSFDDQRLAKAKQVFDEEHLSTNQVIEVVKVFSFDDSKLAFAKWAYSRTMDKKNYYKLDDQFSFGNTKEQLSDFVKKQPK
jgi:hypothetical protein